jgi:hypothetical protein
MATVTGLTAARMKAIEDASVVDGAVVTDDLILTKYNGVQINAGNVRGPKGDPGDIPPVAVWAAPVLLNSWVNYDATLYEPAGYYLDRKRVFLKGHIMSGVMDVPLFTLPVGFRPPLRVLTPVITAGGPTRLDIKNTGDVVIVAGGTNVWVSLSNVSFRID